MQVIRTNLVVQDAIPFDAASLIKGTAKHVLREEYVCHKVVVMEYTRLHNQFLALHSQCEQKLTHPKISEIKWRLKVNLKRLEFLGVAPVKGLLLWEEIGIKNGEKAVAL